MILTPENVTTLSTEDLQEIVWDMYKDINGFRPRHMSTREECLDWLHYELQPEVLVQREAERVAEDAYWAQFEAEMAAGHAFDEQSQVEMFDYPGMKYEHLEEVK